MGFLLRACLFSLFCIGSVFSQDLILEKSHTSDAPKLRDNKNLREIALGNRLHALKKGDEIVYDFQQSITLIRVLNTSDSDITLQVTTATKDVAEREGFSSWLAWADKGCSGASTDEKVDLHIDSRITVVSQDAKRVGWLITLLGLTPTSVPEKSRRKAGPAPMPEELDLRSQWQPRVIVDGQNVGGSSDAYSFHWPNDNSPLSDRTIIAYFPRSPKAVPALPYWIESPSSSAHVSVLDSHRD
jgi:hypothetical protein